MFGVEKIRDPYYDELTRSVFSELNSKYGEKRENKDSRGLKVFSPEDALKELKELINNPETRKHF
jgi:hypothetical protein